MSFLLFGSFGWIGRQFVNLLDEKGLTYVHADKNIRCQNLAEIEAELERVKPSTVISFVGRTSGPGCASIDYLEDKLALNMADNLFAIVLLHQACQRRGIYFVYIGTGCIFDYEKDVNREPFTVTDEPNFTGSAYSTVKGFTDRYMQQVATDALNVRLRMPISAENHPKDFISKISNYARICNSLNSMTILPDLLPLLLDDIQAKKTGTVHLTNPGAITHVDILNMIEPVPSFSLMNEEEQNELLRSRRSKNVLVSSYPTAPPIAKSIQTILVNRNKSFRKTPTLPSFQSNQA